MPHLHPEPTDVERELALLRTSLQELAAEPGHPFIAQAVDGAADPDLVRLTGSMAYLVAWHRAASADDVQRAEARRIAAVAPHLLEPVPAMATVALAPEPSQSGVERVPAGSPLMAAARTDAGAGGSPCRFQTASATTVAPVELAEAQWERRDDAAALRLRLRLTRSADRRRALPPTLRLHVSGADATSNDLLRLLADEVVLTRVTPVDPAGQAAGVETRREIGQRGVRLPGLSLANDRGRRADFALLDWPADADEGMRLLCELAAFPEKFAYVDVPIPSPQFDAKSDVAGFDLLVQFRPGTVPATSSGGRELGGRLHLHCVPATNTFQSESRSLDLSGGGEALLTPIDFAGGDDPREVVRVTSLRLGDGTELRPDQYEVIRRARAGRLVTSIVLHDPAPSAAAAAAVAGLVCCDGARSEQVDAESLAVIAPGGPTNFRGVGTVRARTLPPMSNALPGLARSIAATLHPWPITTDKLREAIGLAGRFASHGSRSHLHGRSIDRVEARRRVVIRRGAARPATRVTVRLHDAISTRVPDWLVERVLRQVGTCWRTAGELSSLRLKKS